MYRMSASAFLLPTLPPAVFEETTAASLYLFQPLMLELVDEGRGGNGENETLYQYYSENLTNNNFSAVNKNRDFLFTSLEKGLFSGALVLMIILGLVGNGLTISAVLKRRFRLRTPANYFVLNLAFADFSISVIVNSIHLANIWSLFVKNNLNACRILATLSLLGCSESFFTLTAIAIFRFLGVHNSFQDLKRRRLLAFTLIGLTWLMSVAFAISNAAIETENLYSPEAMTCLYKFRETTMAVLTLFLIIACLVIVTATYFSLVVRLVVNEHEQKRCFTTIELPNPSTCRGQSFSFPAVGVFESKNNNNKQAGVEPHDPLLTAARSVSKRRLLSLASTSSFPALFHHQNQRVSLITNSSYNRLNLSKTVKTVIFLVTLIYIFWIPTFVLQGLARRQVYIPHQLSMFALLLAHANSSINFIVYAVFNKFFRGALANFVSMAPCCAKFSRRQRGKPAVVVLSASRDYRQHNDINNNNNTLRKNNNQAPTKQRGFPAVELQNAEISNNSMPRFYVGSPEIDRRGHQSRQAPGINNTTNPTSASYVYACYRQQNQRQQTAAIEEDEQKQLLDHYRHYYTPSGHQNNQNQNSPRHTYYYQKTPEKRHQGYN